MHVYFIILDWCCTFIVAEISCKFFYIIYELVSKLLLFTCLFLVCYVTTRLVSV